MAEVENFICPECNKKWSYVKISPGIMKETISIELGGEKELCPDCMQTNKKKSNVMRITMNKSYDPVFLGFQLLLAIYVSGALTVFIWRELAQWSVLATIITLAIEGFLILYGVEKN